MKSLLYWGAALTTVITAAAFAAARAGDASKPLHLAPFQGNPGVITIAHPESFSQVLALSDAHGMYAPLLQLLRANGVIDSSSRWSAGNTLLVVVGDSIDKGPQSIEVLDLWMALSAQAQVAGGQVVHLLGNHEAEFLADPTNDQKATELLGELRAQGIPLSELTDPSRPRAAYLRSMPLAARVGDWILCHAGLLPALGWADLGARASALIDAGSYGDALFADDGSILEAKKWWADPSRRAALEQTLDALGARGVIFGHQPKALNVVGQDAISADGRLVKIDNGMAPEAGSHAGHLLRFAAPAQLGVPGAPRADQLGPDGAASALAPESAVEPADSAVAATADE